MQAGPLADPTRPPPSFSVGVSAAGDGGGSSPRPAPDEPAPLLQGLQMPAQGAAMAMIDGRLVKAGDTVGTRRVAAIDVNGVLLEGQAGPLRLSLIDGSPKQPAGSALAPRSARYAPPATADADTTAKRGSSPGMTPPSPAMPGSLSVAGRSSP